MLPQLVVILSVPALLLYAEKRVKWIALLGPVVLCYLVGILAAALPIWTPNMEISRLASGVSALIAIPLVLFSTDLASWKRVAGKAMLSFVLCIAAAMVAVSLAYLLVGDKLVEGRMLAGMTLGVYTGGTVNLNIIATILGASPELIGQANLADLLLSSFYLLLLFTIMQRIVLLFLPAFKAPQKVDSEEIDEPASETPFHVRDIPKALGLGILVGGGSLGLGELAGLFIEFGMSQNKQMLTYTIALIAVTGGALWLSSFRKVRELPGTFQLGEYFLLVFCVAIGLMIDVTALLNISAIIDLLRFMAIAIYGAIFLHFVLARIFNIDADTAIITSVAAVFSPIFVPPIARVLNNKAIIASGMTTGVIGFVVGSFLGLLVWWVLP